MGVFLGRIDVKGDFYNFTPLYEYENNRLSRLAEADYQRIIPDSEKRNINFSYSPYAPEAVDFMESHFFEDVPIAFEFDNEELELNIDRSGYLNPTGYKIRTRDMYEAGRIKSVSSIDCYLLFDEDEITGDFRTSNILELGTDRLTSETKVMIRDKKDGVLVGPFDVSFRNVDQTFIISIHPEDNRYMLPAYEAGACEFIYLDLEGKNVIYVKPNVGASIKHIDIINDKKLMEAFKSGIKDDLLVDGKLDLNDINVAVDAFEKSPFMVDDNTIRRRRLQRITDMLEIGADVEDSVRYVSETLGSELGLLIAKYDDKESETSFFNVLLEQNPEILNKLQEYSYAKRKVEELENQEEQLIDRIGNHQSDLENLDSLRLRDSKTIHELDNLESEITAAKETLETIKSETLELEKKYEGLSEYEQLERGVADLKKENDYLEMRKAQLSRETTELGSRLSEISTNIEKKISETPIDGLVANLLVEASSAWKSRKEKESYYEIIEKCGKIDATEKTPEQMVDYMYERIREVRPLYDKNTVTNICTCIFQNFLTVFSGDPGCGKTSICNIVGQALGLEVIGDIVSKDAIRYIPVSVERGWTSKRDFIGYYNPLTKSFDKNNKRVFEALQIADLEEEKGITQLPMVILLDEANLSPMEYYWADFMNVCDDLAASNEINIGEGTILNIPETLHFVATINNDHTTETLSPRLIDRAAVITLPKMSLRALSSSTQTGNIKRENIEIISWNTIKNTYIDTPGDVLSFPTTTRRAYEEVIKPHLRKQHIYVSPRTELALIRYCIVASRLFDRDADYGKREPSLIALDYAISQKILPKFSGYGEEYAEWLNELMKKCEENYLIRSKEIISDIIEKGNANMNYYQFFA